MAKASEPRIKVTHRISGEVARKFHVVAADRGLKKDKTVELLIAGFLAGRFKL